MAEAERLIKIQRKSGSAESALRAQQKRIDAMNIEERVKSALSMRERFNWLRTVSKGA